MKNILDYYYHFANISLHYSNGVYSFFRDHSFYLLKEMNRSIEEIREIYDLLTLKPSRYHKIILNKDHQVITVVDQKPYILLQVLIKTERPFLLDYLFKREEGYEQVRQFSSLIRTNWTDLWSRKIDYYEYQIEHIQTKYPMLATSLYYYIGLAENAISYVMDTNLHEKKEEQDILTLSHIRLYASTTAMDYYDPSTIILDHKARDIAGYLKSAFFDDSYQERQIQQLLKMSQLSRYGFRLLMGRMLYPSYYFDLYDQIIIGRKEEKEIKEVIKKAEDYRRYLKMIYHYISETVEIPKVDWL